VGYLADGLEEGGRAGLLDAGFEEVGGLEEDRGKDARPQTSYEAVKLLV